MDNGWILIKDRLPEFNKDVLVTTVGSKLLIAAYNCECKHWYLASNGTIFASNPIAWQPLPKPYRRNETINKTKVKIFEGISDESEVINGWLEDNPNVKILSMSIFPLHDYYTGTNTVCNQWFSTVITYEEV